MTVEIGIKMSEETYKNNQSRIKEIQAERCTVEKAILNGTPLDEIRDEVLKYIDNLESIASEIYNIFEQVQYTNSFMKSAEDESVNYIYIEKSNNGK